MEGRQRGKLFCSENGAIHCILSEKWGYGKFLVWRMQLRQICMLEKWKYGKIVCLKNATTANLYAWKMKIRQNHVLKNATTANSNAWKMKIRQNRVLKNATTANSNAWKMKIRQNRVLEECKYGKLIWLSERVTVLVFWKNRNKDFFSTRKNSTDVLLEVWS